MAKLWVWLVILLFGVAVAELDETYNGAQLLRLKLSSQSQLDGLRDLEGTLDGVEFWLSPSLKKPVDVYVPQKHVTTVYAQLKELQISFQVSIPDVGALIAQQNKNSDRQNEMNWDNYQRYDTIMSYLDQLAQRYPDIVAVETYGNSTHGRTLKIIRIGRNSRPAKPAFFLDGGIHAREWIGPATVTWFMKELVEDPSNSDILDGVDIYITPIGNPDGYEWTHTNTRLWRKTRSDHNSPLGCLGVDPNRNFEYEWGGPGTSADKCSDIYKGPVAWSEPETRAIRDFVLRKRDEGVNWTAYFAIHSYAQMWLVPWGWTYDLPPTYDELVEFGNVGASALTAVHGTQYEVGSVTELLSPGAGGSDDWAYGSGIFRYSQTVEVRDTGRHGFLLPPEQIIPCAQETFAAIQAVARFVMSKHN